VVFGGGCLRVWCAKASQISMHVCVSACVAQAPTTKSSIGFAVASAPALFAFMAFPAACPVTLKRCVTVEFAGQNKWIIESTELINGVEFVPLKIKGSGFGRFVTGSIKKMRDTSGMTFLTDLQKLRLQATIDACNKPDAAALFDDMPASVQARKKARSDAKVKMELGNAPAIVVVTCPAIDLPGGTRLGPVRMKVKSSLDLRDVPVVELDAHTLYYVKMAMVQSECQDSAPHEPTSDNVRWRSDRQAWVATRDGKFKHFKPTDASDPDSKAEARQNAVRWAVSMDDCDAPVDDDANADVGALPVHDGLESENNVAEACSHEADMGDDADHGASGGA
jgi:hypothetical protein